MLFLIQGLIDILKLIPFLCHINFFKSLLTTQMTVVHQNTLSTVMLTNDKLSNGKVRLHLATPEIC